MCMHSWLPVIGEVHAGVWIAERIFVVFNFMIGARTGKIN